MRLAAFDSLRDRHCSLAELVDGLEAEVVAILEKDPNAVIDDRVLSDRLRLTTDQEEDLALLLVDLVADAELKTTVFWRCANGLGTSMEAATIPELPALLECDRCGDEHGFSADYLEIKFLPAASLLRAISSSRRSAKP